MALAPLEYMVLGCPGNQFTEKVVPELNAIQDKGLIRVVDLIFVRKNADGTVVALEAHDLDDNEVEALGPIRDNLMGLITPQDIVTLSDTLPADMSATIVLLEHLWLDKLETAVEQANGVVYLGGMIPHPTLQQINQELASSQAQNEDQQ